MDTLKQCFKCNTEKPLSEFYKHNQMSDGYLGKCKECTKKDALQYRKDNYYKVLKYDRGRGMLPHRIAQRKQYEKTEAGKIACNRAKSKYNKMYPLRKAANTILGNAVRDKKVIKPKHCSVCNKKKRIYGHHEDYYKPLDVIWVCAICHKAIHKHPLLEPKS